MVEVDDDDEMDGGDTPGGSSGTALTPGGSRASRGKWTAEEDEILRQAVDQHGGKNWKKISECLVGRTDVQCLHRWQKVLRPGLIKGPWTKEVGCGVGKGHYSFLLPLVCLFVRAVVSSVQSTDWCLPCMCACVWTGGSTGV